MFYPMYMQRIYNKYSYTLISYHTCSKILTFVFHYLLICLYNADRIANNVDPDQTPRSVASDLGLHY